MIMTEKKDKFQEKEKSQDIFYHGVFNLQETPKETEKKPVEKKEEKPADLRTEFENERIKWKDTILSMANKFKTMNVLTELQVELYSNRQIVLESSHYLQSLLAKVTKTYRKSLGSKTVDFMNGDRKLKMGETNILVESAVADLKEQIDLFESQIEYLQETKKNIDNMVFGLGHRIQLEEYRRAT
jgi:hypothetical protein